MATYNSNKWDEWIHLTLQGDKNAYRMLLNDLQPWLNAYFRKRIHESAVEDLVQDTLMTLHRKMNTFRPDQPFGPWIAAVARHRRIDYLRKQMKVTEVEIIEDILATQDHTDHTAGKDVEDLLSQLPSQQAKVIQMVKLQEMSIKDVSEKTGHSPSSVKVMVHRGIKKNDDNCTGQ